MILICIVVPLLTFYIKESKGKKWRVPNILYSHLAYLFGIFGVFENIIKIKVLLSMVLSINVYLRTHQSSMIICTSFRVLLIVV